MSKGNTFFIWGQKKEIDWKRKNLFVSFCRGTIDSSILGRIFNCSSTVCSKKNAANFQMKSFQLFFRSTFLKFCMQVVMASNIIYVNSKYPPRLGRGHQPPRRAANWIATSAHYAYISCGTASRHSIEKRDLLFYYDALMGTSDQGCQNAYKSGLPSAAIIFIYIGIYSYIHCSIGTCMQNFNETDRQKNQAFFI